MSYTLNLGAWNSVFAVPDAVVDNYLKIASGVNIKILLYLLRNSGAPLDDNMISNAVGADTETVSDALVFWEQMGIIRRSDGGYTPSENSAKATPSVKSANSEKQESEKISALTAAKKIQLERDPDFLPIEIARTVRGDDKVDYLFKKCEQMKGKPLTHSEQNALLVIFDENGLPVEITILLAEYCNSIGKLTPAYMKSVAKNWIETEINTIEKAEAHVKRLQSNNAISNELRKLLDVPTAFTDKQKVYIENWTQTLGFSTDMIYEAYQQTMNQIGKMQFAYMDKILNSWSESGFKTPADIVADKERVRKENSDNSSFDADSLDRISMEKYKKK